MGETCFVVKDIVTGLYYTGKKSAGDKWGPYEQAQKGDKVKAKGAIGGLRNGNKNPMIVVPCVKEF